MAAAASTLLIPSTASVTMKRLPPAPPNSSGTSIPMRPRSKYLGSSAGSIFPAFSISATRGRTCSSAKAATALRNMISSSERRVSAPPDGEVVVSVGIDTNVRSLENDFRQFFVQAERGCHTEGDARKRSRDCRDQARDIGSGMFARREHVGENNYLRCSCTHTVGKAFGDVRVGQLHVGMAHDDIFTRQPLNELRHLREHLVRLVFARTVIDDQNSLHNLENGGATTG